MAGREVAKVVNRCNDAKESCNLDLSGCSLTQIPDAVYLLMKNTLLQSCDLSANLIPKLPTKLALKFTTITCLNLSRNRVSSLPGELRQMECLEDLDLSHNHFTEVPPVLYTMASLKKLSFEDNSVKDVDVQRLKRLPHMNTLNFRDNPLTFEAYSKLITVSDVLTVILTPQDPEFDSVD